MKKSVNYGLPTANIAINKSRLKQYEKNSSIPIYYLEKSSEFQIELFNPTTNSILAVIRLNNRTISQGGLVLRPGERIFLDRYLDIARKFKFDTYNVADSSEVKNAIKDNGNFEVEFYNEILSTPHFPYYIYETPTYNPYWVDLANTFNSTLGLNELYNNTQYGSITNTSFTTNASYTNMYNPTDTLKSLRDEKSIETGRVEEGSHSNQKMGTVNREWGLFPFHTIKYKLLPISQKVNTIEDIKIKRYCTNCGSKIKSNHKFCPNCGHKI